MNKKVYVKPHKRKNPKSKGEHRVSGHTRKNDNRKNEQIERLRKWKEKVSSEDSSSSGGRHDERLESVKEADDIYYYLKDEGRVEESELKEKFNSYIVDDLIERGAIGTDRFSGKRWCEFLTNRYDRWLDYKEERREKVREMYDE